MLPIFILVLIASAIAGIIYLIKKKRRAFFIIFSVYFFVVSLLFLPLAYFVNKSADGNRQVVESTDSNTQAISSSDTSTTPLGTSFTSSNGGFSVRMLGTPSETISKNGGQSIVTSTSNGVLYTVAYQSIGVSITSSDMAKSLFGTVAQGQAQASGMKIQSQDDVPGQQYPTKLVSLSDGKGGGAEQEYIATQTTLYILGAVSSTSVDEQAWLHFIDSFNLK